MLTANQLLTFSEEEVEGVTVFKMYDWSTAVGQDYGLVDLTEDGAGGVDRAYTGTYYAHRLMARRLVGGKERLEYSAAGLADQTRIMVTRDAENVYVIVLRVGAGAEGSVGVDLTAIGGGSGTVTVWEYSSDIEDAVMDTLSMTEAQFSFAVPASGISLAWVDRAALELRRERRFLGNGVPSVSGRPQPPAIDCTPGIR